MMVWDSILETVAASWPKCSAERRQLRSWSHARRRGDACCGSGLPSSANVLRVTGWLPGYADPEYFLRLLFQSTSRTNEGGFADAAFDELIEKARQDRSDRGRLERFHEADRYAVADRVAVIPLVYGRSTAFVQPYVRGWWGVQQTLRLVRRCHGRAGSIGSNRCSTSSRKRLRKRERRPSS